MIRPVAFWQETYVGKDARPLADMLFNWVGFT